MHTGKVGTTSKTVAMFCPSQSVNYADEDTSDIVLDADGNIIPFTRSTIYLGTEISDSLDSTADVERRIKKALLEEILDIRTRVLFISVCA